MITELIVYGLLVLLILSWNQPKQSLKHKSIYEQNGCGCGYSRIQSRPFCRQNKKR